MKRASDGLRRFGRWRRHGARLVCALAIAGTASWTPAQVRLPAMGDAATEELPVAMERRYGDQIMREVWRDPAYLDDAVLGDYVQALWSSLLEAAQARGDIDGEAKAQFAWRTFLVKDRSVNAFALPGGYVGIHLGLIAMTASESELAAVLAHELSHVTQRHIARGLANSSRQTMAGLAALVLGMWAASRTGSADVAQAAIAGSQAAVIQGQLNFSRDMEREADRIGYGIFNQAGFDAAGMGGMFEKLDQAGRLNDSGSFPYLRTHPLTSERLAEARARLVAPQAGASAARPSVLHELMKARARVLMDTGEAALRRHAALVGESPGPQAAPGDLYAGVLAAAMIDDRSAVHRGLDALERRFGPSRAEAQGAATALGLLKAEALFAIGDARAAEAALRALPASGSRAALLARAAASVRNDSGDARDSPGGLKEIEEGLRAWLAAHADDAQAWELLGQVSGRMGRQLQSLRAQAEARAAMGDLPAAIDRLRRAQRASSGAQGAELMDAAVIDARLKALERQWREWAASMSRTPAQGPG